MTDRKLRDFPCPVCKAPIKGTIVPEVAIMESKRSPVLVPVKCPNKHDVALYVDKQFTIRDAEPLVDPKTPTGLAKASKWMSDL